VFRKSISGIRNSKPCLECVKTLKDMNIRGVYYSLDDGSLVYEKVCNIINTHRTHMTRHIAGEF